MNQPDETTKANISGLKPNKWQFTLRGLIVVTLLIACGVAPLAYLSSRAKRERAIADLYAATLSYDFQYDEQEDMYRVDATPPGPWLLRRIFDDTMFAQVRQLEIRGNPTLTNIDRMRELKGLKSLVIYNCPQLENLNGLANSQLKILCLDKCPKLTNIDPLRGVTSLEFFNLWSCPAVPNVNALADANLTRFNLKDCPLVQNIDSLEGHTNLNFCYLRECTGLKNVDGLVDCMLTIFSIAGSDQLLTPSGLSNLGSVRQMVLLDCEMQSLEEVWKYFDVKMMRFYRCPNLANLKGIDQARGIGTLELSECPSLTSLDGLEKSRADAAYIFDCETLTDIKALDAMTNLQEVRIEDCPQVDRSAIEAILDKVDRRREATTKSNRHSINETN